MADQTQRSWDCWAEEVTEFALKDIEKELGTATDYHIQAHLYKFLLYEPGCFFRKHLDTERLEGLFGTLVLELPSDYVGADLNIWSPLTPGEKMTYAFGGGESLSSEIKAEDGGSTTKRLRVDPGANKNKTMKFAVRVVRLRVCFGYNHFRCHSN